MRIGISGAQCTGKTTLLNALRSEDMFKKYNICTEVTRTVASYGLPINEDGNDITQTLIMNQHIVNWFMNSKMLTDRTVLDGYVYSIYLLETGNIKRQTLNYAREVFNKLIKKYDVLFYIAPEFELEEDGVRSVGVHFRNRIVNLFDSVIVDENVNVVKISGSVRERVEKVVNIIFNYEE
jgi:nicotinamide riboside kinase